VTNVLKASGRRGESTSADVRLVLLDLRTITADRLDERIGTSSITTHWLPAAGAAYAP
jgi:hypothetical protein